MSEPAGGERLPIVDCVRLWSIVVVMAVHLGASGLTKLGGSAAHDDPWLYFARNGSYGVTLFFVVSGFVITRTLLRRDPDFAQLDLRRFYVRRAGRILPLFLLVVGLGVFGLTFVAENTPGREFCLRDPKARFDGWLWATLASFSFNWLRLSRESESYGFGLHWDVLWSLSIEEQFYLGYPLVLKALATRRRVSALLWAAVALGPSTRLAVTLLRPERFLLAFTNSFAAFEQIALGALLCFGLERWRTQPPRRWEKLAGLFGLAVIVATYRYTSLESPWDRVWGPSAIALALCLFLAAGIRAGWLDSRLPAALSYPGQLSYGAYLFHATTLLALWPMLSGLSPYLAFPIYAVATFGLAALIYHAFEVPANRAIRNALDANR